MGAAEPPSPEGTAMIRASLLERPSAIFAFLALASAGLLAAAFAFQYIGGLEPCVLCVWQRYPYGVVIALSVPGLILARARPAPQGALALLAGLTALAFFADTALAAFHVGVEQHWWEGTEGCTAAGTGADTVEDLRRQLLAQKVVPCDEVAWSLGGISMAGYNLLASLGLGVVAALAALRMARSHSDQGGSDG